MAKVDFKQTREDFKEINQGLKDQISYAKELGLLKNQYEKSNEREKNILSDVLDKTKSIFENRKSLTEETINSVDLHKLERKLIAEGLHDQVKMVQKLKEEEKVQKRINSIVNQQVKAYSGIGEKIDGIIKGIPGVGGMLSSILGTDNLGKEMGEELRTALSGPNGVLSFLKGASEEATGGFVTNFLTAGGTAGAGGTGSGKMARSRKRLAEFFFGPALGLALSTVALSSLTAAGMKEGMMSVGVKNTLKRVFFGGAFEGLRDAFGNMGQADFGTLMSMQLRRMMFGVSGGDQAKILAAQLNISGATKEQALNIQEQVANTAALNAVLPSKVFEDLAANTEMFAKYSKDGGLNIGMAAVKARQLGIELSTIDKIADSVLNFQSSIEAELSASLLTGKQLNLNRARELALMGDISGLQDEILKQVGSEAELQQMNVVARKKLADAFGITVSELSRLASGELEIQNSDMKQNTTALRNLTYVMAAAAVLQGGRALGRGFSFVKSKLAKDRARLATTTLADYRKSGAAFQGVTRKEFMMSNPAARSAGLARVGGQMAGFARGGYIGLAVAAVLGIPLILNSIDKNTKRSANSARKSVTDMNQMVSATVLQHGK